MSAGDSAEDWPLYVDVEYAADGPQLLCAGWRLRPRLAHPPVPLVCGMAIHGGTLAEFRQSLREHLRVVTHCEEPMPLCLAAGKETPVTFVPTSVFQLARMRHLDLLALLCELRPNDSAPPGGLTATGGRPRLGSKEQLVKLILAEQARHARLAASVLESPVGWHRSQSR